MKRAAPRSRSSRPRASTVRRAHGRRAAILLCLAAGLPLARGQDAARADISREAARALEEGLPEVAAYKLRGFLAGNPAPADRRHAILLLARALLTTNDPAAALALLDGEQPAGADAEFSFWRAQADAALGRWDQALALYTGAEPDPAVAPQARFGEAEALDALGRTAQSDAAFAQLEHDPALRARARLRRAAIALRAGNVKDAAALLIGPEITAGMNAPERKQYLYLLGQVRLAERQPELAEQMFTSALASPNGLSEALVRDNYWGWAHALLDQGKLDKAQDSLENFIERYPHSTYLGPTLDWLAQLYMRDPAPDLSDLRRWTLDSKAPDRQAQAILALAQVDAHAGRAERAEEALSRFEADFPGAALGSRAWLDLAELFLGQRRPADARAALEHARALAAASGEAAPRTAVEILGARISVAEGDYAGAARRFEAVASNAGTVAEAEAAAFNAALGWLRAGDTARFGAAQRDFARRYPRSPLNAEFPLEEGLARAARVGLDDRIGRQDAAACLNGFLREFPTHPRAADARIALAELYYDRPFPNLAGARRELASPELRTVANENAPGGEADPRTDRAEYLAIWLADTPGLGRDEDKAITLAEKFLQQHPESSLAPEARMKLCEIYFRKEDYSDAQTQLELLVEKTPNSPLAEQALYLAGLAAARSMNPAGLDKAVALFEAAAGRNGRFKLPARLRQAELQKRLDKGRDALILYDGVLAATAGDRRLSDVELESRCAALCGRGDTLFGLAEKDPALYADAVRAFDALAAMPGASLPWRREALTKKGKALEDMGDTTAALAAYDDALNIEPLPDEPPEAEWTWYYRAGRDAAHLLEARSQWAPAIAIYKKLAAADGPLKSEFQDLLSRRRLEHFIWED